MRTILAVNQFTISHPVSILYDQVQKMHQGKLILILTRLSTIVRHLYSMSPLTWQEHCASVMQKDANLLGLLTTTKSLPQRLMYK